MENSAINISTPIYEIESLHVTEMTASGVWVNESGETQLALGEDGRYDKTQGLRHSTYSGRYSFDGATIRFVDDFDFVLTGEIRGDVMRIGKYVYRRA